MAVLFYFFSLAIGINNLVNMLFTQFVLCLDFLKLLARIYEQNIIIFLTAFFITRIQVGILVP